MAVTKPQVSYHDVAVLEADAEVIAAGWRALKLPGTPPAPVDLADHAMWGIPLEAVELLCEIDSCAVWEYPGGGRGLRVAFDEGSDTTAPVRIAFTLAPEGLVPLITASRHGAWNLNDLHKAVGTRVQPLGPILRSYAERPIEVLPATRRDTRILPRVHVSESVERIRGRLFGGLLDHRKAADLPLFPELFREAPRVPILDLADLSGVPVMARGRGAPLSARLFVRVLVTVEPSDRKHLAVRVTLTLRELRDALYPNGWRVGQHWPELRHALIHARDYTLPSNIVRPDGRISRGRWFPLAVRQLPDAPDLDELVILDVAFPPGADSGPPVDLPEMDSLSVQSASKWRAYIAAHTLAWIPGKTQRPVPRAPGRWGWSRDPEDYPIISLDDRRSLAFGAHDTKHRTTTEIDAAWTNLPGLTLIAEEAVDRKTGEVGWRIVPATAADRISLDGEE